MIPLYELYTRYQDGIIHQPKVRLDQFSSHLTISRVFRDKSRYDPEAEIAVVGESNGEIVAYANGCKVINAGAWGVNNNGAFIRFVLGDRQHRTATRLVIRKVVDHLGCKGAKSIGAFNSFISPVFLGYAGGFLPSNWGWMGDCLAQEGFEVNGVNLRMLRELRGRGSHLEPIPYPEEMEIVSEPIWIRNEIVGLERKYCVARFIKNVVTCNSYYSGAFVRGSGFRYFFTLWLYVSPKHRGKGFGRMFLRNSLVEAHKAGATKGMLITAADNFVAQELYRSEGYRTVDTVYEFISRLSP